VRRNTGLERAKNVKNLRFCGGFIPDLAKIWPKFAPKAEIGQKNDHKTEKK